MMTNKMICPRCKGAAKVDRDSSYYGEMFECIACGYRAYFDEWNEFHEAGGIQLDMFMPW